MSQARRERRWQVARSWFAAVLAFVSVGLMAALPAAAQQSNMAEKSPRTPMPEIARGQGDACVAPVEWMRRNHMHALMNKRDLTMYDGDRAPRFSLNGCVTCHAVPGADGRPVPASNPQHFCSSCHIFAAVKMDCFDCHTSVPDDGGPAPRAGLDVDTDNGGVRASDIAALNRYLGSSETETESLRERQAR